MSVSRLFSFLTARQFIFSDLPKPDDLNTAITDESFDGINESLLAFSGIQPSDLPDLYRKAITKMISESIDGFEDSGQFSHLIDFLNAQQDKAESL